MRQKQPLQLMHITHIPQRMENYSLQAFSAWACSVALSFLSVLWVTWPLLTFIGSVLKRTALFCLLGFPKSQQSKHAIKIETFFFFFLHQLFTTLLYLLDSSFVTSVSTKFTVALGASPTCAKSTSAPYQFTAFTTCIHVTEEHLDTITIIKGAGFILSAGLDSDFTTFLKSEAQVNTSCPIYNQHTFNISKT